MLKAQIMHQHHLSSAPGQLCILLLGPTTLDAGGRVLTPLASGAAGGAHFALALRAERATGPLLLHGKETFDVQRIDRWLHGIGSTLVWDGAALSWGGLKVLLLDPLPKSEWQHIY